VWLAATVFHNVEWLIYFYNLSLKYVVTSFNLTEFTVIVGWNAVIIMQYRIHYTVAVHSG